MKRKNGHTGLWAGFMNIFAVILIFAIMGYQLADSYRFTLDGYLGTVSSVTINNGKEADLYEYTSDYQNTNDLVMAHEQLNERIEEEGVVLLKNEGSALPLFSDEKIKVTFFGMRSYKTQYSGSIGATTSAAQTVSLEQAFKERGYEVNPQMTDFYKNLEKKYTPGKAFASASTMEVKGSSVNEVPLSEYINAPEETYPEYNDAAIIVLGRDCAEGSDYYPGEKGIANPDEFEKGDNILSLSKDERNLITYVKKQLCFQNIIVLINSTNAMEIEELKQDEEIDAILWIGAPGCYGTYGIADVMNKASGISPSGSLVDTYAVNSANSPAAQNFGLYAWENADKIDSSDSFALRANWYLVENEGIYDGYKYYETRYYDSVVNETSNASSSVGSSTEGGWNYDTEVTYPFGYGLSYTTFKEEIILEKSTIQIDGTSTITIRVTNTGNVAGKDNVQLYMALPYQQGQVEKSAIQLIGYAKTGEALEKEGFQQVVYLQPGESEEVTIEVNANYYASYDKKEGDGAYILDEGMYYFAVGNDVHDALQNVMIAQDVLEGEKEEGKTLAYQLDKKVVIDESTAGSKIQNKFEDADINQYISDTTTYLSRSNWAETFPKTIESLTATEEMIVQLRNDTYTMEKNDTAEHQFGTKGKSGDITAADLKGITEYENPIYEQVIALMPLETIAKQIALQYAQMSDFTEISAGDSSCMDGPVGLLRKLGISSQGIYQLDESDPNYDYDLNVFVSEPVVASTFSHKLPEEMGKLVGNDAIYTSDTWWFAPAMNIHRVPYCGRNNEYYSEDSVLTGSMASDTIRGCQSKGFVATVKHFAFNNMETNREGVATFFDEQAGRENELRGFQMAFEQGESKGVMTSFNRIGLTYSSADEGLIAGLLRGEWGFQGIVTTDMVKSPVYETWEESILAGTDVMLNSAPVNVDGKAWESCQAKYIMKDKKMSEAVYQSVHHVLYAFSDSIWLNGYSTDSVIKRVYPFWEIDILLVLGLGVVGTIGSGIMWIRNVRKSKKEKGSEKNA